MTKAAATESAPLRDTDLSVFFAGVEPEAPLASIEIPASLFVGRPMAVVFIVVTIPLARFTDWLVARDRARSAAGSR
jgi:hypothetical protein